MWLFSLDFAGKCKRSRLVNWVEKAIGRLLEITKAECNQELLLSVKNLRELGSSLFHYIVPSSELVEEEHFVLANLFKWISGSSFQAGSTQAEVVEGALVKFFRTEQLSLPEQDPQPAPKR